MKFTKSIDGVLRATICVEFHIEKPLFDWLMKRIGYEDAVKVVLSIYTEHGRDRSCWALAWNKHLNILNDIHVDDIETYKSHGYEVYSNG